ncbi:hypothetical protein sscle_14g099260 [Sclerotinia sclerotiorum 1980 UF-70]|uniref:Uncharacterized protein n=1 Tax=Sclerotinia sclerotiorum (strain ATCC 18683 / 1980 / Ss-1) TaxID=665079 RepID=A0A1D9QJP7_SCLS1|nr:hypothetical protein sscle_14g099260 [Sclerotinia sclerotiorum 1980 UF-70]
MYTEFILVGILHLVSCSGLSSGLSSAVTTPVYLTTSSLQAQSSSTFLISPTTKILVQNSSSVFSSVLSSYSSVSNAPTTSIYTPRTASTTSVVVTNIDNTSISSSTACPSLVARDNDDSDAPLLAASEFHGSINRRSCDTVDYWASAFNNTNYLSLADTIHQAKELADIAESCDSNGTTTEPPPTDPNTPPTVPNPPPKKKRNPWQRFLDWLERQGIRVEPNGDDSIRIIIDRPL